MSKLNTKLHQGFRSKVANVSRFLIVGICWSIVGYAYGATIEVSTAYYVNDKLDTVISSDSSSGLSLSTSGSFTAPSGTTMSGLAGFEKGRFFGTSTMVRTSAFPPWEVLTSATSFRDTFVIDTQGRCPVGGPACQLSFSYTATGEFSATGDLPFSGQLDVGVLNPVTPDDRTTWLVDRPISLTPGHVNITDIASVSFYDNQPFVFWPIFGVVARQSPGSSNGRSTLDFSHGLVFDGLSVIAPQGETISFSFSSESGLTYSPEDFSSVPEPDSFLLAISGLALVAFLRNKFESTKVPPAISRCPIGFRQQLTEL